MFYDILFELIFDVLQSFDAVIGVYSIVYAFPLLIGVNCEVLLKLIEAIAICQIMTIIHVPRG